MTYAEQATLYAEDSTLIPAEHSATCTAYFERECPEVECECGCGLDLRACVAREHEGSAA
jgi:hypothetical protein